MQVFNDYMYSQMSKFIDLQEDAAAKLTIGGKNQIVFLQFK